MNAKLFLGCVVLATVGMVGCETGHRGEIGDGKATTQIAGFQAHPGELIVIGTTQIGRAEDALTFGQGFVAVNCKEFVNMRTGAKTFGIELWVHPPGGPSSFGSVDYLEIEALLMGLDQLTKIPASTTKLKEFEAEYQTKADFRVSALDISGSRVMFVSIGRDEIKRVRLDLNEADQLRRLIQTAKSTLDRLK